jgi:hypothetical protein
MNVNNPTRRSGTLVSAIRGPVVLIILGVLFAIEYNGGPRFSRTWPVLVISFGVLRLLEYLGSQAASGSGNHV